MLETYQWPVVVTVAYAAVYYTIMMYVMTVRVRVARDARDRGERFDRYFSEDRQLLAADRMQLNMLEHMPMFLVGLWVHAVLVGAESAAIAGAVYVASRALYPFMMGRRLGRFVRTRILFATVPGYAVMTYLYIRLLWSVMV